MKAAMLGACMVLSLGVGIGGVAQAATESVTFSGPTAFGAFSGSALLDVENGVAVSGSGSISGDDLGTQTLTLLTAATPGAEVASDGTFGYRSNGGDDFGGFDNIVSSDLLFALGPNPAAPGQNVIFGIYSDGDGGYDSGIFGFSADSTRFYEYDTPGATFTASAVSAAPEPGAWALMLAGVAMIGAMLRVGRRSVASPAV